jgi:hypothetical protein
MSGARVLAYASGPPAGSFAAREGVVEVPLLLPGWQAAALEEAAHARGLTAAAMVRRLLREFLEQEAAIRPLGE